MRQCTFLLNGEKMSLLNLGGLSFHAFSGLGVHVNQRSSSCVLNQGPIPMGSYYVTDRQSGGRLGWLYDSIGGMDQWFALYADKERIDDEMWCDQVKRGHFRLHPKGRRGISQGCIVIDQPTEFQRLRQILRAGSGKKIPGTDMVAWAKVIVR